ncbi:hypothetical protein [Xylanibacter muris]|uniref:Uncharacterized protein n=1 Tax=Xylanibacter muris TaxID=2736290 RepID=A0ABX2APB6_9BACT|nr:hypothetical protein [Xylanibacter muris]NPD93096.1 hypothetical protein [Xylanibacter muris]
MKKNTNHKVPAFPPNAQSRHVPNNLSDSLSERERMGMWNIPNLQWV